MNQKQKLLLDDDDDDDDKVESIKESSTRHQLRINTQYAIEYERRKRLEELQNSKNDLDDMESDNPNTDSDDSSTSSEEDEDAILLTPHLDVQILKTLRAIRSKESIIYDPNQTFFPFEDNKDDDDNNKLDKSKQGPSSSSRKVKRYKDLVRETMLEKMNQKNDNESEPVDDHDDDDEEDEEQEYYPTEKHRLAYDEEQVALRAAFLNSVQEDDEEENNLILRHRKQDAHEDSQTEELIQKEFEALASTRKENALSSTWVDPRGEIEDGEGFLLDYLKNRRWVDTTITQVPPDESTNQRFVNKVQKEISDDMDPNHNSEIDDDDDSLNDLDKTDAFESKYNFRFEEATDISSSGRAPQVVGYSRTSLSDTVRRKEDARKLKREQRKEKKLAERKAKEERLKRLKNAKREEMENCVKKIKGVIKRNWMEGQDADVDENVLLKLLDGDYDADNFDQLMNKAFGDSFYEKKEEEWKTDDDVRASLREDPECRDTIIADDEEAEEDGNDYQVEDGDYADEGYGEEMTELEQKLDAKIEEELYKLDYEDIIDDLPTRFKYRSVEANNYGLTAEEILLASDSTLKQYVSLKRMAPFAEESYNPGSKRRKRFREMLQKELSNFETESKDPVDVSKVDGTERSMVKNKKRRQKKRGRNVDVATKV